MRHSVFTGSALAACLIAGLAAAPLPQKPAATPAEKSGPGAKLAGQWKFNKTLSEEPSSDTTGLSPRPADPGGVPPINGGGTGIGIGGGGYGGRIGGGGMGGGGGVPGMGSPAPQSGFGRNNSEQTLQLHAMVREMNQPPDVWTISAAGQVVTFTTNDGVVRKYTANGRKEKIDLTSARVETTTTWSAAQNALTQEMKVGQVKMTRTIQMSVEGHQLIVLVVAETDGRETQAASKKFIFDRASGALP